MKIIFKIHWRDDKPLNEMDRNELIIKWADELIFHSDHLGKIQTDSFNPALTADTFVHSDILAIRQEAESRLGNINGDLDKRNKWLIDFREGVLNHLLSHRYIKDPVPGEDIWGTSEKGDLVKELGGHFKYQRHRRRELNILKHQSFINRTLVIATILAAVMPFFAERCNKESYPKEIKVILRDSCCIRTPFVQQPLKETALDVVDSSSHKVSIQDTAMRLK